MKKFIDNVRDIVKHPLEVLAANLPEFLANNITLGNKWYDHNGYFKFKQDEKIDCKGPNYFGYGLNPQGWVVKGVEHRHGLDGDRYLIETPEGIQKHFKWNIENHFKYADPKAVPFNPRRFKFNN